MIVAIAVLLFIIAFLALLNLFVFLARGKGAEAFGAAFAAAVEITAGVLLLS